MLEPRTEQSGHKVGEQRKEILQQTSELREYLDTWRRRFNDSFYMDLSDEQWEGFCELALTQLIPGLLIGKMRGLRPGLRKAHELEDYQPCSLEEAIRWFTEPSPDGPALPVHDMKHAVVQRYRFGTVAPTFLSGNVRDVERVPDIRTEDRTPHSLRWRLPTGMQEWFPQALLPDDVVQHESIPFDLRHELTPTVIEDELYAALYGGQLFTYPLFFGEVRVPYSQHRSLALIAHHERFGRYIREYHEDPQKTHDPYMAKLYKEMYKIYKNRDFFGDPISAKESWDIFIRMALVYAYKGVAARAQNRHSPDVAEVITRYAPQHFEQVRNNIPDEVRRVFLYIHRNRSHMLNGGPQMFDLFMAMGKMDTAWLAERDILPDRLQNLT